MKKINLVFSAKPTNRHIKIVVTHDLLVLNQESHYQRDYTPLTLYIFRIIQKNRCYCNNGFTKYCRGDTTRTCDLMGAIYRIKGHNRPIGAISV